MVDLEKKLSTWSLSGLYLVLLIWKNGVLQKRRPLWTAVEILAPTLFMLILVALRQIALVNDTGDFCLERVPEDYDGNNYFEDCKWGAFQPDQGFKAFSSDNCAESGWNVVYTPADTDNLFVMTHAMDHLRAKTNVTINITGVKSPDLVADSLYVNNRTNASCVFVVEFDQLSLDTAVASYTLRFTNVPGGVKSTGTFLDDTLNQETWHTDRSFSSTILGGGPRLSSYSGLYPSIDKYGSDPNYEGNGFLAAQFHINRALVHEMLTRGVSEDAADTATSQMDSMYLQRFPFPRWTDNTFATLIKGILPLFLVLTLLLTALFIVKSVVEEKESGLKETLRMLGITSGIQWSAWFFLYLILMFTSMSIVTIILTAGQVLQHSDGTLIFVYLMLFATSSITFMFMVSVFFHQASTAAASAAVIWFCSYIPYRFLTPDWDSLAPATKTAGCLLSTTCMSIGANVIGELEGTGTGVTWENMYSPVNADDHFTFATVLTMLIVDTFLYAFITLYLDAVLPSQFGTTKPWYFCFLPSFWCSSFSMLRSSGSYSILADDPSDDTSGVTDTDTDTDINNDLFEPTPENVESGLRMQGLRKVFKSFGSTRKVAVTGTTLNLNKGEITALLGHNGAGKTTTMSMISGLVPPTSGTATINGYDIRTSTRLAQSQLGLCPQKNTLIPSLTVIEHLWLFAKLKGVSDKDVYRSIDQMIEDIELLDKRHHLSSTLSGGMKRKLSCALALVGDTPVVILDEPTSGCDPSARRAIWDLLLKNRKGRTMLLSTHHMDEADILGDRIAIMNDGRVACCGTPMFLKTKFAIGYRLSMVVDLSKCDVKNVTALVKTMVTDSVLANQVFSDLSFVLPRDGSPSFEALFTKLENDKDDLGILSYGMAGASIEDVFLRVGEDAGTSDDNTTTTNTANDSFEMDETANGDDVDELGVNFVKVTGSSLVWLQFYAMFVKRWLHLRRNKMAIVSQLLVPSAFTLMALVIGNSVSTTRSSPPRSLNNFGNNYGATNVVYGNTSLFPPTNTWWGDKTDIVFDEMTSRNIQQSLSSLNSACDNSDGCSFGAKKIANFDRHNVVAFDEVTNDGNLTAWFNGQGYHSSAESSLFASNLILNNYGEGRIDVTNHPLPEQPGSVVYQQQNGVGLLVAIFMLFGMSFLVAFFAIFPVTERVTKAKHMQLLSGVSVWVFWLSTLAFDSVNLLLPTLINVVLFASFEVDAYSGNRLVDVFLLLAVYGLASLPMMYLWSFMFVRPASAFSFGVLFNVVTGIVAVLTVFFLQAADAKDVPTVEQALLFLPNFCFGQALIDMNTNYIQQDLLQKLKSVFQLVTGKSEINCQIARDTCDEINKLNVDSLKALCQSLNCQDDYLAMEAPGIGRYLVAMVLQSLACMFFLVVIEFDLLNKLKRFAIETFELADPSSTLSVNQQDTNPDEEDDDVVAERDRIAEESDHDDILVIKDLKKVYKMPWCSGEVDAVKGLSAGISRGSCFGLLGVNGAGKTTTFKMLTGDETISGGCALIDGFDVTKQLTRARPKVGYAPQFDALIERMTGRELLVMYARLRGVPSQHIDSEVNLLVRTLMLGKHVDRLSKTYSGGNKRKLSTALALIGSPPVVMLDEPTSGMDPMARRALWSTLTTAMKNGQTIVLTSHSMEECDALCSTLAIMVNGVFKCFGSPQHLKGKFGKGCSITILAGNEQATQKSNLFLKENFPTAKVEDEHSSTIKVRLEETISLAKLFAVMEAGKQNQIFQEYSISQTTLEEVFIKFARDQTDVHEREQMYKLNQ